MHADRDVVAQVHFRKRPTEPDVDLMQLARDLPGLTGIFCNRAKAVMRVATPVSSPRFFGRAGWGTSSCHAAQRKLCTMTAMISAK